MDRIKFNTVRNFFKGSNKIVNQDFDKKSIFEKEKSLYSSNEKYVYNQDGTYTVITEPGAGMCGGSRVSKTYNKDSKLLKEVRTSLGTDKPYTWTTKYNEDGTYSVTHSNDRGGKDIKWIKYYNKDGSVIKQK